MQQVTDFNPSNGIQTTFVNNIRMNGGTTVPNNHMRHRVSLIAGIALLGLWLASCGSSRDGANSHGNSSNKSNPLNGPEGIISLYKNHCMQCHGNEMQGMMGPQSNLQKVGSRLKKDQIRNTIQNGGKLMPAQGGRLNKEDIDKIADWLASKK